MTRHALLVLGMHRSGTSALTRMINLLGASVPSQLMPPSEDNPGGYWESQPLARFNNQLLQSAGCRWNDDAAIPAEWFSDTARAADHTAALRLFEDSVAGAPVVVFKDPRLCRLLPFWLEVLRDAGRQPHAVLLLRDPLEVVRSLQARQHHEPSRPAAIAAESRGLLLWLRYVLDAELHSRGLPRAVLRYDELLNDWRGCLPALVHDAQLPLPLPDAATAAAIDNHLDPRLCRQGAGSAPGAANLPGLEQARALQQSCPAATDPLRQRLEPLLTAYAPLRRNAAISKNPEDPWGRQILTLLDGKLRRRGGMRLPSGTHGPRVLFVSGVPGSAGHVYRVELPLQALQAGGWQGDWCALDDPELLSLAASADLVCVFRAPWNAVLQQLRKLCRRRSIPLVADIDDLIFDRTLMEQGRIEIVAQLAEAKRQQWLKKAESYRETLRHADAVVVTTNPLAAAITPLNRRVYPLSNGLSEAMLAAPAKARQRLEQESGSSVTLIGFASGTPSHQRDFAVVAEPLARLLQRHSDLRLVLVGWIDPSVHPCLVTCAGQIERRPKVPLLDLYGEVARFSINLAPLEIDNPFNAGKSAIRVTTAAAVAVPSVASPTAPLQDAIVAGHSGLLANTAEEWEAGIEQLLLEPGLRSAMGSAAQIDVISRFGWTDWAEQARSVYATILAEFSTASGGIHIASP